MKYKTFFLICLFFSSIASADDQAQMFDKNWTSCKSDSECKVITGLCNQGQAVNKKYQKDVESFNGLMSARIDCSTMEPGPKHEAKCVSEQCTLM